ncbi:hypothetical protein A8144_12600 [Mycobacterium leprae 3125609]|nr:hypothetical protein A8144_12600 [Mycobacterium leprae 3125609]
MLALRDLAEGNATLARMVPACQHDDVTLQELEPGPLTGLSAGHRGCTVHHLPTHRLADQQRRGDDGHQSMSQRTVSKCSSAPNHLGHFTLTRLVFDRLLPVHDSRIVTVSSLSHRQQAEIHFDDLQWECHYNRIAAYGQSKLANLLFN